MNTDLLENFNFEQIGAVGLTVILILGLCFFFCYRFIKMALDKERKDK
jgi:cell division protein FtsW (lipid II flippase)